MLGLELVRVRPRRLLLRHLDFTDYWGAFGYRDRLLSTDYVIRIRPGFIRARPRAESDLELQNPCEPERMVVTEIR